MFDFSHLEETKTLCVRCKTPEETRTFWEEVFRTYKNVVYDESDVRYFFSEAHTRFGEDVVYRLTRSRRRINCGWDKGSYFVNMGYTVFNFSDLMRGGCDFGELSEDSFDLSYLFGGDQTDV